MSGHREYKANSPIRMPASSIGGLQTDHAAPTVTVQQSQEVLACATQIGDDLRDSDKEALRVKEEKKSALRNFHSLPKPSVEAKSMDEGVGSLAPSEPSVAAAADGDEELRRFAALSPRMRRAVLQYPTFIAAAFHRYAITGSSEDALHQLMQRTPEMLRSLDNAEFAENPIGQALLKKQAAVSEFYISLASRTNARWALEHRNSSGHTLLMLAAELGEDKPELLEQLVAERPGQVHECYDCDGRNALHHCAMDGGHKGLAAILKACGRRPRELTAALEMPDNDCLSPLHLMAAASDGVEMLKVVRDWAKEQQAAVDFSQGCQHACGRSLLAVAVGAGRTETCRWLLHEAKVELDRGALELAAKNAEMSDLLQQSFPGQTSVASISTDAGFSEATVDDDWYCDEEPEDEDAEMVTEELKSLDVGSQSVSSECREQLSKELQQRRCGDKFVQALMRAVPELRPNEDFLKLTQDPVYVALTLLLDLGAESRSSVEQALRHIGQADLCSLLQPT